MDQLPTRPRLGLLELAQEYASVETKLIRDAEENQGEISEHFQLYLDTIESEIEYKADAYHYVLERLSHGAAHLAAEATRFERAAKTLNVARERIKERMMLAMQTLDVNEVRGTNFRFKLQKNASPKLETAPELADNPPDEYIKIKRLLDVSKLREDLEAGKEIPGAKLVQGFHVRSYINKGDL